MAANQIRNFSKKNAREGYAGAMDETRMKREQTKISSKSWKMKNFLRKNLRKFLLFHFSNVCGGNSL